MIIKNKANIKEFLSEIKSKKLYCYGTGKIFNDFLLTHPNVNIFSVVDKQAKLLKNKFPNIDFIEPEKFLEKCDTPNSVLLITCLDYIELENKLQREELLRRFNVNFPTDGIYSLNDNISAQELCEKLNKKIPLCTYCVDNPIEWEKCSIQPLLDDWGSVE